MKEAPREIPDKSVDERRNSTILRSGEALFDLAARERGGYTWKGNLPARGTSAFKKQNRKRGFVGEEQEKKKD